MSCMMQQIQWSKDEMTIKDFASEFGCSLPVLCITRVGYSGCDGDIHEIGSNEIYFVHKIQSQKRIVAFQNNPDGASSCYVSIPINYPVKVQIIAGGKIGPPVPISEVMRRIQDGNHALTFQFENNEIVSFQMGADYGATTRLGRLEVEDTYEEKYLISHPIHSGKIFSNAVGIPVYLDITVSVGMELNVGGNQAFDMWMKEIQKDIRNFEIIPVKMCQEIIMFKERPSNGMYEYIKPSSFATLQSTEKHSKGQLVTDINQNEYVKQRTKPRDRETGGSLKIATSMALPAFPRRPAPSVPDVVGQPGEEKVLAKRPTPLPKPCMSPAVKSPPWEKPQNAIFSPVNDIPYVSLRSVESAVSQPPLETNVKLVGRSVKIPKQHAEYEALKSPTLACYKTPEEIPPDIDVKDFTVQDVSTMLRLLRLENRRSAFEKEQVDGRLLLELDDDILVHDFEFTLFEAKKLTMFVKDGWRPKTT